MSVCEPGRADMLTCGFGDHYLLTNTVDKPGTTAMYCISEYSSTSTISTLLPSCTT